MYQDVEFYDFVLKGVMILGIPFMVIWICYSVSDYLVERKWQNFRKGTEKEDANL